MAFDSGQGTRLGSAWQWSANELFLDHLVSNVVRTSTSSYGMEILQSLLLVCNVIVALPSLKLVFNNKIANYSFLVISHRFTYYH